MLTRAPYLDWISHHYPKVRHNLAASGIPALSVSETVAIEPRWCDDPIGSLGGSLAACHGLSVAELLPCNGASQALWLAYAATLEPGDEVLVESPAYAPFADAPATLGAHVRRFARRASTGYAIDADEIRGSLGPKTRVVALTHLHNPTGNPADRGAVAAIAASLMERHGFVIVNEIYASFNRSAADGPALQSCRSIAPNIVGVGSLSKAFGLGPERIGWLTGPETVVARAAAAQLASTGDLARSWAASALGMIEHLPRLAARARDLVEGNRERVTRWIADRPQLEWWPPDDGLFGLVRLPRGIDGRRLAEAAIANHGVIVAPGEFFDAPATFRLAWGCSSTQLQSALDALSDALSDVGIVPDNRPQ